MYRGGVCTQAIKSQIFFFPPNETMRRILLTSVSLIQLSSPLSNPPTPLSETLDGTPS